MAGQEWVLTVPASVETGQAPDLEEVRRFLKLVLLEDKGTQLHFLHKVGDKKWNKWYSFAANDLDGMLELIAQKSLDGSVIGCYWNLNPLPIGLDHCSIVKDVLARRFFVVDVDSIRPDSDDNATDAEKDVAREVTNRILGYLSDLEWPVPLILDSGNGWHLLYRIDLDNDNFARALLVKCLQRLIDLFSTDGVDIDRKLVDARRISKIAGTWARKGPHSEARPHRLARIVFQPDTLEVVTAEQLVQMTNGGAETESVNGIPTADSLPTAEPTANGTAAGAAPWILPVVNAPGRLHWVRRKLDGIAARFRLCGPATHDRNSILNWGAYKMGQVLRWSGLPRSEVEARLLEAVVACGLPEGEARRTIKSGLDAGEADPQEPTGWTEEGQSHPEQPEEQKTEEQKGKLWRVEVDGEIIAEGPPGSFLVNRGPTGQKIEIFEINSLDYLLEQNYPEPRWVIPGILSEGLNILAGKPKVRKSMMALNLGMTIAGGGKALGQVKVEQGEVLYLSLEDSLRRVRARAQLMAKGLVNCGISPKLKVVTTWPRQSEGGLDLMELWFKEARNPTLVIIDVWSIFRPLSKPQRGQYEQDNDHMRELKKFLDSKKCPGLVLLHCRKGTGNKVQDILEEVTGTMGLTGAADGIIVLTRTRGENDAKIFVTGRDVADQELALEFDSQTLTWKSLGNAEEHLRGKLQIAVVDYLKSLGGTAAFSKDIAAALDKDPESVRITLNKLFHKRIIRKHGNAWAYPGEDESAASHQGEAF